MKPLAEVVADHVSSVLATISGAASVMAHRAYANDHERAIYQAGASDVLLATALALGLPADFAPMLLGVQTMRTLDEAPRTLSPSWRVDARLTRREREVAEMVVQGLSNDRIADELVLSFDTVRSHRANIYKRLGVHSVAVLTNWLQANPGPAEVPRES